MVGERAKGAEGSNAVPVEIGSRYPTVDPAIIAAAKVVKE
jgi:hypothetical protein